MLLQFLFLENIFFYFSPGWSWICHSPAFAFFNKSYKHTPPQLVLQNILRNVDNNILSKVYCNFALDAYGPRILVCEIFLIIASIELFLWINKYCSFYNDCTFLVTYNKKYIHFFDILNFGRIHVYRISRWYSELSWCLL